MNCPSCTTELKMAERQGVEIDYCPQCRGVWLDRGELDKIIERAMPAEPRASETRRDGGEGYESHKTPRPPYRDDDNYRYGDRHSYGQHGPRKKKSFLGELFDFD